MSSCSLPKLSVIIPCYNHAAYVARTLTSVYVDTYPNKEIVIIDDGSKDNSKEVIEKWIEEHSDADIRFYSRSNKGLCATLNELINYSGGEFVLLLASDDVLIGNTIYERIRILVENESIGKYVIVSDSISVDENEVEVFNSTMEQYNRGDKSKYQTDSGILRETIVNPSISGAVVIVNKKIYGIVGLYPTDLYAEDWFFYQRAAAINAIIFYDKKVSLYRLHDSNTSGLGSTNKQKVKLFGSIIKIYSRNYRWFKKGNVRILTIKQIAKYMLLLVYTNAKIKLNVGNN